MKTTLNKLILIQITILPDYYQIKNVLKNALEIKINSIQQPAPPP